MRKTVIFDFDGTLGDSFALALDLFYEITHRTEPLPDTEIARLRQLPLSKMVKEIGIHMWQVPGLIMKGRRLMHDRMHEVKAFAGMEPVIRALHDKGYRLFVVSSNSVPNLERFLEAHSLRDCFEEIYGGVGVLGKTPVLKKIMRRQHLKSEDCWYVGDEVRDIHGAHGAGLRVAAVTWGYQQPEALQAEQPDALITTPEALMTLFERSRI